MLHSQIQFKWPPCDWRKQSSRARTFVTVIRDLVSLTLFQLSDWLCVVVVRFMRHNGLFGTQTGKGAVLVLVTVFRQRNLQFWLMLALFYMRMFWHVAPEALPKHFWLVRLLTRLKLGSWNFCIAQRIFSVIELKFVCLFVKISRLNTSNTALNAVNIVWFIIHSHILA